MGEPKPVRALIERTLVDYFDHFQNGTTVENYGGEWFLRCGDLDISLTELAVALSRPISETER
jgi:hypothetical protein